MLVLFAGPRDRADSLEAYLRALGLRVVAIDTKIGGGDHDVGRRDVRERLLARARNGEFIAVFAAPPCKSFSIAHRPMLRTSQFPEGLPMVPREWEDYVSRHNGFAAFTFQVAAAVEVCGGVALIENPAARSGPPVGALEAYWRRHAMHGSMWHLRVARASQMRRVTFAQCSFGALVQKYTTIAMSALVAEICAAELGSMTCQHGHAQHDFQAIGRDQQGRSRSEAAAAYPTRMNVYLAAVIRVAVARARQGAHAVETRQGGRITEGIGLSSGVDAAVEARRFTEPRFASWRHRLATPRAELRVEAFPGDLHRCMSHVCKVARAPKKGRPLPTANSAASSGSNAASSGDDASTRPTGAIHVEWLFLPGVYEQHVASFLEQARAAVAALRAGKPVPTVDTVVLPQEAMPAWARGCVWDTRDRHDCRPVQRSTRHTAMPGPRQLDRAAIRRVAAAADSTDRDLLEQIGEGGVETRSECPLTTVLSWHHRGVEKHTAAAEAVIQDDMANEWVSPLFTHPPMVPLRVLPRNVVMQPRTRLLSDGRTLEHYEKPRISQDSSDGAEASPNGGVPRAESGVELPTVQQFGRGLAIADEAGTPYDDARACQGSVRADGYCVDATSAFRFLVMQRADWWTQCFLFWACDEQGVLTVGICIDMRMAFGGSYSPNRFERLSRLIGAYVQQRQQAFDESQPPPPCAREWMRMRRQRQTAGLLPSGDHQCTPKFLQAFIDDWAGCALNDAVRVPAELSHICISDATTRAAGGQPSSSIARVRVHAMLVIDSLVSLGLEASADKTMLGDVVIALGIRVSRVVRRLDVPAGKRATMLDDIDKALNLALAEQPLVEVEQARRITGRASNLSQVLPEVLDVLHGGYRVVNNEGTRRNAGLRAARGLRLRRGSPAWCGWVDMLRGVRAAVDANLGVELAGLLVFARRDAAGSATCITDASGCDGVGGYVFLADLPGHVWIVSEFWPTDIQLALDEAAKPREQRSSTATLPMPAAELFGAWAVALAVAEASVPIYRVFAVGDCQPAAAVLHDMRSNNTVMRAVLAGASMVTREWLAVAVPREMNLDADRLSHPNECDQVMQEARMAGLQAHRVRIQQGSWALLRGAITKAGLERQAE